MKKLILSLVIVAFAFAVQAGDSKACAGKDKAACSANKTACSADKTACSTDKTACTMKTGDAGCCHGTATKAAPARQTLMSPKGAEQAPKLLASR